MTRKTSQRLTPQIQSTIGAILSALLLLFAISHLAAFAETGLVSVLLFSVAEIVIAVLFLLRMPTPEGRDDADADAPSIDEARVHRSGSSSGGIGGTGRYSRC